MLRAALAALVALALVACPAFAGHDEPIGGSQLPLPTPSSLGGVESQTCGAGQFLTSIPATETQPGCAPPSGGSGGLVKIVTRTASNSTALQFGQGQTEGSLAALGYNTLFIDCNAIVTGTSSAYVYLQEGESTGPTWETANYGWVTQYVGPISGLSTGTYGGSATLANNVGIGFQNAGLSGHLTNFQFYFQPASGGAPLFQGSAFEYNGNYYGLRPYGIYTGDTNNMTALQVVVYSTINVQETGSAALVSGQCTLYGLED